MNTRITPSKAYLEMSLEHQKMSDDIKNLLQDLIADTCSNIIKVQGQALIKFYYITPDQEKFYELKTCFIDVREDTKQTAISKIQTILNTIPDAINKSKIIIK